jgi:hypothetical protein
MAPEWVMPPVAGMGTWTIATRTVTMAIHTAVKAILCTFINNVLLSNMFSGIVIGQC